jgi:hypothetical protein
MPELLRSAFVKYLVSFDDYVKDTKGILLGFQTVKNQNGIELKVSLDSETSIDDVEEYLDEYIGLIKQNEPNVKDKIEVKVLTKKIEFLELRYQTQVSQFKNDLLLADYKIKHLEKDVTYFKDILFLKAKKPNLVYVNQNQSQILKQSLSLNLEDLNQIQDIITSFKDCIDNNDLKKEADVIQSDLDSLKDDNIKDSKKAKIKKRFKNFFSKLKKGINEITWTSKALESLMKGKDSLQKLADFLGVDIKDIIDAIINSVK